MSNSSKRCGWIASHVPEEPCVRLDPPWRCDRGELSGGWEWADNQIGEKSGHWHDYAL